jgi:hypothetical protein
MSGNAKKSMGWMMVLILLGVAALYAGARSLAVLIPAAVLVWYASGPAVRGGRN